MSHCNKTVNKNLQNTCFRRFLSIGGFQCDNQNYIHYNLMLLLLPMQLLLNTATTNKTIAIVLPLLLLLLQQLPLLLLILTQILLFQLQLLPQQLRSSNQILSSTILVSDDQRVVRPQLAKHIHRDPDFRFRNVPYLHAYCCMPIKVRFKIYAWCGI